MDVILPQRLGIRYENPALYLLYKTPHSNKTRKRKIPLRLIKEAVEKHTESVNLDEIISSIKARHEAFLKHCRTSQVEKLISMTLKHHHITAKEPVKIVDGALNLNALNDTELAKIKETMQAEFVKKQVAKDDPNFVYDLKKDFGPPTEKNDWDSDTEDAPAVINPPAVTNTETKSNKSSFLEIEDDIEEDIVVAEDSESDDFEFIKKTIAKPEVVPKQEESSKPEAAPKQEEPSKAETPSKLEEPSKAETPVPKKNTEFLDDFGLGHTDSEHGDADDGDVVFSDDGLSFEKSSSDDAF